MLVAAGRRGYGCVDGQVTLRFCGEEREHVGIARKKVVVITAAVAAASALLATRDARAAAYVWDGSDSATNTNWSNALNWTADLGSPSSVADTATFDNTGIANPINTVDTSLSIGK